MFCSPTLKHSSRFESFINSSLSGNCTNSMYVTKSDGQYPQMMYLMVLVVAVCAIAKFVTFLANLCAKDPKKQEDTKQFANHLDA